MSPTCPRCRDETAARIFRSSAAHEWSLCVLLCPQVTERTRDAWSQRLCTLGQADCPITLAHAATRSTMLLCSGALCCAWGRLELFAPRQHVHKLLRAHCRQQHKGEGQITRSRCTPFYGTVLCPCFTLIFMATPLLNIKIAIRHGARRSPEAALCRSKHRFALV